jgi:hypothetical protein
MGNVWRYFNLLLLLAALGVLSASVTVEAEDGDEEILVGRIAHVEGELLRYIEEDKDWVLTVKDSPFGLEDALYSGDDAKAEFIMPNRTWFRVGENTQLQLIALKPDATTVDVASGLARVYNKSDDAVIKVTTPFGYVVAPGGTVFDLYVGDESLEVIAVQGGVDFVHEGTKERYEVKEGSSSIIADASEAARGNGTVDSDWDDWNGKRDDIWMQRLQQSESSAGFLPEPIRYESYALEENGRWERVHYDGVYRDMWRPTRVDPGWRPFTAGRWTVYYGDNCWIPDESFGYVTHHYGSWVYVESSHAWYWVPPAARLVADTPEVFIGFGWYPGRVGWIHSGPSVGWVPLAPSEVYYGYRPWGHRTVIVKHNTVINITNIRYRFLDEAVIIDRDHFYRGSRYTQYVQRDVHRDILINNYRPITVINNTVITNFNSDKRRFAYNDVKVSRKPHDTVMNRISDNEKSSRNFGRGDRERIERDLTQINARSELPSKTDMHRPMVANRLVDADKISKPLDTLSLQKKEIKPKDRERQVTKGNEQRRGPREQGKVDQPGDNANQEEKRRLRSPRESRKEVPEQVNRQQDQVRSPAEGGRRQDQGMQQRQADEERGRERQQPPSPKMVKQKRQEELQKGQTPPQPDDQRSLKSPRDKGKQETEQSALQQDQGRPQKDSQVRQEQKLKRQQSEEDGRRQEREIQQRQVEEGKGREKQQPPSPKLVKGKQQEELQQGPTPPQPVDQRSLKSPKDRGKQEAEQGAPQQDQIRQQKENQVRQEQEVRRQQQEEGQRRQEKELQQRQAEEGKAKQEAERGALRQDQARQQKESQVRQEQQMKRQQQEEGQRRQEKEVQQRQAEEGKAKQEAERNALRQDQARQQKESQVRQEQQMKRQQQEEGQRRQEKELQQRQQKEQQQENQRRQEQEQQRQQQEAKQVQQKPEKQRQQPEAAPNPQEQQQQAAKKNKKQQEEEERLQQEQQSPKK